MLIVIPSLIIVFMMLVIVYLVNFNKHKSKRDLRYTITEKNLYRRDDELKRPDRKLEKNLFMKIKRGTGSRSEILTDAQERILKRHPKIQKDLKFDLCG